MDALFGRGIEMNLQFMTDKELVTYAENRAEFQQEGLLQEILMRLAVSCGHSFGQRMLHGPAYKEELRAIQQRRR